MSTRRDDLIDTALRLFYTGGFNATGIDKILAESGVAKMTLYKHFRSKDDLILAALERRDTQFRAWLFGQMAESAADPGAQILAMFDALETWFAGEAFPGLGFSGCAFINAASEFGAQDHPAHRMASVHKRLIVDELSRICAEAGYAQPGQLAEQLALLKEGAIATAHVRGMREAAGIARSMAVMVLESAPLGG